MSLIDFGQGRFSFSRAIVAAAARTNGTVNGDDIDTRNAITTVFAIQPGTITDGTHAAKLQESSVGGGSGYTDVAAGDVQGAFAGNLTSNTNQQVTYIGSKRFVRLVVVTSGATTGGIFSAVAVQELKRV